MFEQQLGRSVTIDQAAAFLKVSRRTIYNRIRDHKLLTIRTLGGSQRVLVASLEENRNVAWSVRRPSGSPAPAAYHVDPTRFAAAGNKEH